MSTGGALGWAFDGWGMQLTFLGTGSAMPTGDRVQSGLLIEDRSQALLIDCGSGVLSRLAGTNVGYTGIDGLLLTHHHLDHLSDLMVLLKARWLAGAEAFQIAGPPGTQELVEHLFEIHSYMQDLIDLELRDIEPGKFQFIDFDIEAVETQHSMYCHAYRVRNKSGDVTISGDTEAIEGVADFADGSSVLVHDCSFPDEVDVSNHPTPASLGSTLAGYQYGTVFLTHLYPHTDGQHEEMLNSINENYDGEVRFARDGLSVAV